MLKYVDIKIVFQEIPEEITLAINISNCPCHCKGCHSAYLADDIGIELNEEALANLISSNKGITCVAFMGGDSSPLEVEHLAAFIRDKYTGLLTAWYSGREYGYYTKVNYKVFNFVKYGPYREEFGPLNKKGTNQILFRTHIDKEGLLTLEDITSKLQK